MTASLNIGFGTPWAEQIDFLRQKLRLPTERWDDIQRAAHDRAFIVAGAAKADLLADLQEAVIRAAEAGMGVAQFQREFRAVVAKHGWTGWTGEGSAAGEAWRARIIYQTNMATSYAAGRYRQLTDPDYLRLRPYWRYIHSEGVAYPRPQHLAWHGLTLLHDHPFWQTHFAPNGWHCHCRIVAVSRTEGEASARAGLGEPPAGWDTIDPKTGAPVGIDKGFDYAPGANRHALLRDLLQAKLLKLSPELAVALQAEADKVLGKSTPNPAPWREHTAGTAEGDWHNAAFLGAPQWLKDTVAKRGALTGGVTTNETGAFFHGAQDKINMQAGAYDNQASPPNQATWRHEYGHAIDHTLRTQKAQRSADADFTDAMVEDAHELAIMGGHGPKSHKVTKAAIAKLQAAYAGSAQELLQAPDRTQWLADRYAKNGLDFSQVQAAMQAQTDFATNLQGADLDGRYARIITAIEQRDAQGLMDALTGGMEPKSMIERRETYEKGALGNLSDLFGSATNNKVSGHSKSGFGHEDTYYKRNPIAAQAECFANLTCFYGDASPVWGQIIEAMTPRMAQLFKEIMK